MSNSTFIMEMGLTLLVISGPHYQQNTGGGVVKHYSERDDRVQMSNEIRKRIYHIYHSPADSQLDAEWVLSDFL